MTGEKGRHWRDRTHCKNGHPYDDINTKWVVNKNWLPFKPSMRGRSRQLVTV